MHNSQSGALGLSETPWMQKNYASLKNDIPYSNELSKTPKHENGLKTQTNYPKSEPTISESHK